MSQTINLAVEKDHIESITKANGITAISELIWNSLDADATNIQIEYTKNSLDGFDTIIVLDDGHGLAYDKVVEVFGRLGGSQKKNNFQSPNGRYYHGKEGKGRYKAMALGDLVKFESRFKKNGKVEKFFVTIDRNNLLNSEISDLEIVNEKNIKAGFTVTINNINNKNASQAVNQEARKELEEKFASYWINYPTFIITFNGHKLEFESLIRNTKEKEVFYKVGRFDYKFLIKVIEWNFENSRKTYFCSTKGIPFTETNLGIRSSLNISIFIQSSYIEKLYRDNTLNVGELDETLNAAYNDAKKIARDYIRERLHHYSHEFIAQLKREGLYPFKNEAETVIEKTKRQVFDIVALQINEYLPSFNEQDKNGKKLTLSLIKEALETDSKNLQKILSEAIELPEEKREELVEILEKTTLSNIIDTMKSVTDRLAFLNGLEQMIYDKNLNKNIKERKHLHKVIINETWIFGDEYTYGCDDITLKNVLKAYIKDALKRDDFEEQIASEENEELESSIPDVCLWSQINLGKPGHFENLVIELKKPIIDAGIEEYSQIQLYANKVSQDRRFPKAKTKWKFLLITKDIKPIFEPQLRQQNRVYGHVYEGENVDIYVLTWGDIINQAKTRYQFVREKLNITLESNEEGLEYLKNKYKEYLPEHFNSLEIEKADESMLII